MEDRGLELNDGTTFLCGNIKSQVKTCEDSSQPCYAQRWIICYMGLIFGVVSYLLSTNMSVAIVCMVKIPDVNILQLNVTHSLNITNGQYTKGNVTNVPVSGSNNHKTLKYRNFEENSIISVNYTLNISSNLQIDVTTENTQYEESNPDHQCQIFGQSLNSPNAEFTWDKTTQSLILSGYYYGYSASQIPGGWLSARFGGKVTIASCLSVASMLTLLIPTLARWSPYSLVVARAIMGIVLGITTPAWLALTVQWALPNERNRFIGMCWFGHNLGIIVAFTSSGLLCTYGFDNGWASIFYVDGLAGVLFVITWLVLVYSSPKAHPRISIAERTLLENNIKIDVNAKRKMKNLPWRKILTYVPVYAMITAHVCDTWTYYLLLTCLPLYLKEVLLFDITSNGMFSSLPLITTCVGIVVASPLADYIRSKQILRNTTIRKTFQITGFLAIATFIVIPGYLTCDKRELVIICICLCTFFESMGYVVGYTGNAVDMSPQYSSLIYALSNTVAALSGIFAPVVVANLTPNQTREEWRIVLFIAAGVAIFGAIVYGAFSSSELAPWADEQDIEYEVELDQNTLKDSSETAEIN